MHVRACTQNPYCQGMVLKYTCTLMYIQEIHTNFLRDTCPKTLTVSLNTLHEYAHNHKQAPEIGKRVGTKTDTVIDTSLVPGWVHGGKHCTSFWIHGPTNGRQRTSFKITEVLKW